MFTDSEIPALSGTPSTQNINTDTGLPNATVSWTPPSVSDNSGEAVTLTSDYSPGDTFPIGTTTVTYTATDTSGNTATSAFNVVVTGKYVGQFSKRENKQFRITSFFMIIPVYFACWHGSHKHPKTCDNDT